jgi:hypothetical protein
VNAFALLLHEAGRYVEVGGVDRSIQENLGLAIELLLQLKYVGCLGSSQSSAQVPFLHDEIDREGQLEE